MSSCLVELYKVDSQKLDVFREGNKVERDRRENCQLTPNYERPKSQTPAKHLTRKHLPYKAVIIVNVAAVVVVVVIVVVVVNVVGIVIATT